MNKVVILLIILGVVGIGGIYTNFPQQEKTISSSSQATKRSERDHGRMVFKGTNGSLPNLPKAAANATSDNVSTVIGVGLPVLNPLATPLVFNEYLKRAVCNADAIVIGTIKAQTPYLTDDETFIYTDNEMSVEDLIKNNADAPIQPNGFITVARAGGKLRLNGRNVLTKYEALQFLEIDQKYLLFLSYIPEKREYVANSNNGSFLLEKNKINNLTPSTYKEFQSGKDASILINEIRGAVSSTCDSQVQEGAK